MSHADTESGGYIDRQIPEHEAMALPTRPVPRLSLVRPPAVSDATVEGRRACGGAADLQQRVTTARQVSRGGVLRGDPAFRADLGRAGGAVVVTLHGVLDDGDAALFAYLLADLIGGQGNQAVVVDLGDLRHADPSGLEVFAAAALWAEGCGGTLRLYAPCPDMAAALAQAGLSRLLDDGIEPRGGGTTRLGIRQWAIAGHPSSVDGCEGRRPPEGPAVRAEPALELHDRGLGPSATTEAGFQ